MTAGTGEAALAPTPATPRRVGLALRLALRDLRGGLSGFRVFLACLAVGVAAVAAVLSISRALQEGIAAEGRFILGGDLAISIIHRQADASELGYIDGLGTVSQTASVRSMARAGTAEPAMVELKAVDGAYPLYGQVTLKPAGPLGAALAEREGTYGIAAEDALLARLGVAVGQMVRIGNADYQVRGVIESEPDRAADGIAFGPRVIMSEDGFRSSGLIQPGSLIRWTYRVALPSGADDEAQLARTVAGAEDHFVSTGWRVRSRSKAAPGVQEFIDRLTLFLSLVGLTALVVGGVGVANAAAAHLDAKRPVIATLKCLGAPAALVFRAYLIEMMVLAGLGVAIGLVVGAGLPFVLQGALGAAIALPLRVDIYLGPLGYAALCGLLTAFVFSLWPLGRARQIAPAALFRDIVAPSSAWPPRAVLATMAVAVLALAALVVLGAEDRWIAAIYVAGAVVSFAALTAMGRGLMWAMRRLPRPKLPELRLGLANLSRPGAATPGVVLSLGLGLTMLVMVGLIDANMERELTSQLPQNAPSFFVLDIPKEGRADFAAVAKRAVGVGEVDIVPMLRGHITELKGRPASEIAEEGGEGTWVLRGDRGVTYAQDLPEGNELVTGTWWPPDYQGKQLVSFVDDEAKALGLNVGDTLTVNVLGRDLKATIASTRKVNWRGLGINFVMIFSPGIIAQAPHGWLATVSMDRAGEAGFVRDLAATLPSATAVGVRDALAAVADLLEDIMLAIRSAGAVAIVAGALVLSGAIAAGRRRRIYDAVVLKAFGVTRGSIFAAYLTEFAVLGLVTALFAVAAGSLAAYFVLVWAMDSEFVLMGGVVLGIVALSVAATVIVGFLGTWTALSAKAAPILRSP